MFQVGQKLFASFGGGRNRNDCWMEITKVGRKWLELDGHYRADISDLVIDGRGYSSPGKCYLNKEEHDAEVALTNAWSSLTRAFPMYSKPKHLTIEDIEKVKQILGIKP